MTMAKILIVEKESVVAEYLQEALENLGHQVLGSVASGEKAIEVAQETQPDLVLMDVRLKNTLDGIATAEQIHSRFHIPVVYLTAHADNSLLRSVSTLNFLSDQVKAFQGGEAHTTTEIGVPQSSWLRPKSGTETLLEDSAVRMRSDPGGVSGRAMVVQGLPSPEQAISAIHQRELTLELTQVSLIARLQERIVQLQQALSCTQMLKRLMTQIEHGVTQIQILQTLIQELGSFLEADYSWIALYNPNHTLATISCDYTTPDDPTSYPSMRGTQIKMHRFSDFYGSLLQKESWIDPPLEQLPVPYQYLPTTESKLLVSPLMDEERVIGEVGILSSGKPIWSQLQAELISQVVSQGAAVLRQVYSYQVPPQSLGNLELLNELKENFIRSISYELCTPLTNMRRAVEMLSSLVCSCQRDDIQLEVSPNQQPLWQTLDHSLQILREEWQREFDLVSDLLNFHGWETFTLSLPLSPIDLKQWLPELVNGFSDQSVRQKQILSCEVSSLVSSVVSHKPSLEQIVTELLTNACKFSPPDSWIAVTAEVQEENLVINVTNTGVTILSEEFDRIFQPFYRIPHPNYCNYSGTGLGLAVVKKLVHALGGEIRVQSGARKTTFTVTLFQGTSKN